MTSELRRAVAAALRGMDHARHGQRRHDGKTDGDLDRGYVPPIASGSPLPIFCVQQ